MKVFYQSQNRFNAKIIKHWEKKGFKYHTGHIQLLRFSFLTLKYWSCINGNRISEVNKVEINPKLF